MTNQLFRLRDLALQRQGWDDEFENVRKKHADILAERVLFLDGLPNFQAIHRLKVGETVEEILQRCLALFDHRRDNLIEQASQWEGGSVVVMHDTNGHLYRLDLTSPGEIDTLTGRVTSWAAEDFFWAGDHQPFFQRPSIAPAGSAPATP